jgi:hypothetical protein
LMQLKAQYNSLLEFEQPVKAITVEKEEPDLKEEEAIKRRRILLS